jgi:hypothetical protein
VCLLYAILGSAQTGSIPLTDVIDQYERKHGIKFLFDNDLLEGVRVDIDTTQINLSTITANLQEQTAFDFQIDNKTVLIKPRKPGTNLKICGMIMDPEENIPVPGVSIYDKQKTFGISTDVDGKFTALVRLSEKNKVVIQMMGYEQKEFPMAYFNTGKCLNVALVPDVKLLNDVVVNAYMSSGIDYSLLWARG